MIKTNELRGIFAKNGKSQTDVAKMLGITPKTFYGKMQKGIFNSNEIQAMIDEFHIEDPVGVFFAKAD